MMSRMSVAVKSVTHLELVIGKSLVEVCRIPELLSFPVLLQAGDDYRNARRLIQSDKRFRWHGLQRSRDSVKPTKTYSPQQHELCAKCDRVTALSVACGMVCKKQQTWCKAQAL